MQTQLSELAVAHVHGLSDSNMEKSMFKNSLNILHLTCLLNTGFTAFYDPLKVMHANTEASLVAKMFKESRILVHSNVQQTFQFSEV